MSILTVSNLNHSYGSREILQNVNFRLLKGEHVGLVGPNGEGKSSFMNIVTGRLMPDEGKIEWARRVRIGQIRRCGKCCGMHLPIYMKWKRK